MKRTAALLATGLVAWLWAFGAGATPITVKFNGFVNGYRVGSISGVRNVSGVAAGEFDFNVSDNGGVYWDDELKAFCIDVNDDLVTGTSVMYDLVAAGPSGALSSEQLSLISQLYDGHAGALGNATNDAAFQLALWEILYDSGGPLELQNDGNFSASTFNTSRDLAQVWLDGLVANANYQSSKYELYVLGADYPEVNQTLITAHSVPEPGTLSLLGVGLIAFGITRRRLARRAASARAH
jgi:hypothetical protein